MTCNEPQNRQYHFVTVLFIGLSASLWAVGSSSVQMPLIWLVLLLLFILFDQPREMPLFLRRVAKIALMLLGVSFLQIVFRRGGTPLLAAGGTVLVFSDGLREAVLLWIRFMILFILARVMARTTMYRFLAFTNSMRLPLNFGLLLLMTVKLLPFIFSEARRVLWFMRFRGISFRRLAFRQKIHMVRQLVYALLMRCVQYAFHSALTLELRGYGQPQRRRLHTGLPFRFSDALLAAGTALVNGAGLLLF